MKKGDVIKVFLIALVICFISSVSSIYSSDGKCIIDGVSYSEGECIFPSLNPLQPYVCIERCMPAEPTCIGYDWTKSGEYTLFGGYNYFGQWGCCGNDVNEHFIETVQPSEVVDNTYEKCCNSESDCAVLEIIKDSSSVRCLESGGAAVSLNSQGEEILVSCFEGELSYLGKSNNPVISPKTDGPVINIINPKAQTYEFLGQVDPLMQYSIKKKDGSACSDCECYFSYDNGETKQSLSCEGSLRKQLYPIEGSNTWTIFANGDGGESIKSVSFDVIPSYSTNWQKSEIISQYWADSSMNLISTIEKGKMVYAVVQFSTDDLRNINYEIRKSDGELFYLDPLEHVNSF